MYTITSTVLIITMIINFLLPCMNLTKDEWAVFRISTIKLSAEDFGNDSDIMIWIAMEIDLHIHTVKYYSAS